MWAMHLLASSNTGETIHVFARINQCFFFAFLLRFVPTSLPLVPA